MRSLVDYNRDVQVDLGRYGVTAHVRYSAADIMKAFSFEYSNERERSYDQNIAKRYCTADVSIIYNASKSSAVIEVSRDALLSDASNMLGRQPGTLTDELACPLQRYQSVSHSPAALASPWADRSGA